MFDYSANIACTNETKKYFYNKIKKNLGQGHKLLELNRLA